MLTAREIISQDLTPTQSYWWLAHLVLSYALAAIEAQQAYCEARNGTAARTELIGLYLEYSDAHERFFRSLDWLNASYQAATGNCPPHDPREETNFYQALVRDGDYLHRLRGYVRACRVHDIPPEDLLQIIV